MKNRMIEKLSKAANANPMVAAFIADAICKLQDQIEECDPKAFANSIVTYECWRNAGRQAVEAMGFDVVKA
jgi:hypothetical protein